jgi:hypothetical protein
MDQIVDNIRAPLQGGVWAVNVAAAGTAQVDFQADFPDLANGLPATGNRPETFWTNRFISIRAVGGAISAVLSTSNATTLDPTATGGGNRVGVTIPDGQQLDLYHGTERYLLLASTPGARVEVWPTSRTA